MTNEEIVRMIQDEETERPNPQLVTTLWHKVEKYIKLRADIRAREYGNEEMAEDLYHEGYFALLRAIKNYNPCSGSSFIYYLTYYLQTEFNNALGMRTSRQKNDPIHWALSIDVPISTETEDINLKDTINDISALEEMERIEQDDYYRNIHDVIEKAIDKIPKEKERQLIRYIHKQGIGNVAVSEAGQILNIKSPHEKYRHALRNIRNYLTINPKGRLLAKLSGLEVTGYKTSVKRFKNSFTSSVELDVIRREKIRSDIQYMGYSGNKIEQMINIIDNTSRFDM